MGRERMETRDQRERGRERVRWSCGVKLERGMGGAVREREREGVARELER